MNKFKEITQFIGVIISLIAAVITLIVALKSNQTAKKAKETANSTQIELTGVKQEVNKYGKDIENLKKFALNLEISSPHHRAIVRNTNITVTGTINGEVPEGHKLFILLKNRYNYFLQYPPISVSIKEWSQLNVRFASNGSWKILLCLADGQAASYFDNLANQKKWGGFPKLPEGAKILKSIVVTKR
jgi:lipopolysaccharide export LptBFGC system permease protein LptF